MISNNRVYNIQICEKHIQFIYKKKASMLSVFCRRVLVQNKSPLVEKIVSCSGYDGLFQTISRAPYILILV